MRAPLLWYHGGGSRRAAADDVEPFDGPGVCLVQCDHHRADLLERHPPYEVDETTVVAEHLLRSLPRLSLTLRFEMNSVEKL